MKRSSSLKLVEVCTRSLHKQGKLLEGSNIVQKQLSFEYLTVCKYTATGRKKPFTNVVISLEHYGSIIGMSLVTYHDFPMLVNGYIYQCWNTINDHQHWKTAISGFALISIHHSNIGKLIPTSGFTNIPTLVSNIG